MFKTEDGEFIIESGALSLYLVEKYGGSDSKLLGHPDQRLKLLQWIFYGPSTFNPGIVGLWHDEDLKSSPAKLAKFKENLEQKNLTLLSNALGDSNHYLLGSEFTLADIVVSYSLIGLNLMGYIDAEKFPNVAAYIARLMKRESFITAYSV